MKKYGIDISFDGEHRLTKELEMIAEQHQQQGGVMDSREKFEAWLVQEIGDHAENNDKDMIKLLNANVHWLWLGWQAATASQQAKIDELYTENSALKAMLRKHELPASAFELRKND